MTEQLRIGEGDWKGWLQVKPSIIPGAGRGLFACKDIAAKSVLGNYHVVSPNMHKVHHSPLREETDSNYSSVLSVWDRIFGSYRELAADREDRFGLDELQEPETQSFGGLLRTPLFRL